MSWWSFPRTPSGRWTGRTSPRISLADKAPESWVFLKGAIYYERRDIRLELSTTVTSLDINTRSLCLGEGRSMTFDKLLLATGAEPIRLSIPGADRSNVFTLRSLDDSRAIVSKAGESRDPVVVGTSFIGLEVAASLIERGLTVRVVAPESRPLEKVLGSELETS